MRIEVDCKTHHPPESAFFATTDRLQTGSGADGGHLWQDLHAWPSRCRASHSIIRPLTGQAICFGLGRLWIIRNALEYLKRGNHPLGGVCVVWHIGNVLESLIDQSVFIDGEHEIAARFIKKSHSISDDILSFRL